TANRGGPISGPKQPRIAVFREGGARRREPTFLQRNSAVQPVCEALQQDTRSSFAKVYLPKSGRPSPVLLFIAMMKRPDSVTGDFQNVASNNSVRKAEHKIEVVLPDALDVFRRKVLREF